MFSLIPWRWAAALFAIVAIAAGLVGWLDHFGRERFSAGRAEVQAAVDIKTELANAAARETERIHKEQIDAISTEYESRLQATSRAVDVAVSAGDRLRDKIRAASRVRPAESGSPITGPDGTAEALGGLLETCSRLAESSSADSERLAEQLRGLQSYAAAVSGNPPSPVLKE